ncbi:MAG: DNA polymerase I, partial [Chlamydiota bacterium]
TTKAPSNPLQKRYTDKHQYNLIDDETELELLLTQLSKEKEVGIDTETTSIQPLLAELVGIGFSTTPGEASYVPCNGALGDVFVKKALRNFFQSAKCAFFGHNLKYDSHVLENIGISLKKISFDTLLASYLLAPQTRRHNLDELALEKFKKIKIPIETLIGKGKQLRSMWEAPLEQVKDYCCEDVDYTTRLKELFEEELKEKGL